MPRLGRADPVVVAALQAAPIALEGRGHPVDPDLRLEPVLLGRLQHRLRMLVHAHEEVDVVAAKATVARDAVGADLLERVAEVRVAVGVVDGGREVELGQRALLGHGP